MVAAAWRPVEAYNQGRARSTAKLSLLGNCPVSYPCSRAHAAYLHSGKYLFAFIADEFAVSKLISGEFGRKKTYRH
jgi:hypothetical protein